MNKSRVVLISIMDVSGSMGKTKKNMAKLYMNTYKVFLSGKYEEIETKLIAHTTVAKEVNENDFFNGAESGGTFISSGYEKALEIVKEYDSNIYDIQVLQFSDGDNWGEDNELSVKLLSDICQNTGLVQYLELKTSSYTSTIMSRFQEINEDNLYLGKISCIDDVFDRLKETTKLESKMVKQLWSNWHLVVGESLYSYRTKGKLIECKFNDGIRTIAKCLPEDKFDLNIGFEICIKKHQLKKLEKELKSF